MSLLEFGGSLLDDTKKKKKKQAVHPWTIDAMTMWARPKNRADGDKPYYAPAGGFCGSSILGGLPPGDWHF